MSYELKKLIKELENFTKKQDNPVLINNHNYLEFLDKELRLLYYQHQLNK